MLHQAQGLRFIFFLWALPVFLCASQSYAQVENAPSYVQVRDSLLSVEASDALFGDVMKEIAQKVGFKVDINKAVYGKKFSTSFEDIPIERAILRLFSLISEKNYSMYYDDKGRISLIEIQGGEEPPKPKKTTKPLKKPVPKADSQMPRHIQEQPMPPLPPLPPSPDSETQELQEQMDETYPYIPPKEEPVYIPPKKAQ